MDILPWLSTRRVQFLFAIAIFVTPPLQAYGQTDHIVVPSERVTNFVFVRRAPDQDSDEMGRLRIGESAALIRSVPRWYEVRLSSGATGFVSKSWTTVTQTLPIRQQDELRIHNLNVGTGTCVVVECPGANASPMVVDCGSIAQTAGDLSENEVSAYVRNVITQHASPPNVVLSHGDRDHYAYIATALSGIQANNIWIGGSQGEYTSDRFPAWLQTQRSGGATVHNRTRLRANWHNDGQPIGASLSCGLADAFILTVNTGADKNTNSLVLLLEYQDFAMIFSGDAEGETERQAIANFDGSVKANVITGSHHGARTKGSNGAAWATATAPQVTIYSAGDRFSHPTCTAVERFTTVAQTTEHKARCGRGGDDYREYRTRRAEYMTKSVGTVIITSNGRSPMALHCTRSAECGVRISH